MFIPDSAPFNEEQRAWLNGFFAGLTGMPTINNGSVLVGDSSVGASPAIVEETVEDFPWHDAALPIVDRMELAEGKPIERRLMAAMAQLDCGSCGYLCQSYSEAIASGEEKNLTLCSPGGKETKQMIKKLLAEAPVESNGHAVKAENGSKAESAVNWSRKNPFTAKLIESRGLNLEGSAKDTRHVVIDLAGSGMTYQVGDALGVLPQNCDDLARRIVRHISADPLTQVSSPLGHVKTLMEALCEDCCLKDPTDELLELLIDRTSGNSVQSQLQTMLAEGVPDGLDVLDILEFAPSATISATEFMETLGPLNPRLYSIASSMKHVGEQVHLTVGKVTFEREGRLRKGVASTMLADRVDAGSPVRVFVQPNHAGFTVPSDPALPMIMVGPGTGIAPFIAFLQERAMTKATGKNWLFFGDQHEACDFLYRDELSEYIQSGCLTRLDTAFSRDGQNKVYVQDKMRQSSAELWRWLNEGALFYVCGDASRMAQDVDRALKEIIAQEGGLSEVEAAEFVKNLTATGRYHRDVY